ncbi:MAG TPA: hypothetical protein VF785_00470 [Gemmatimonadaceae bacterium]
MNQSRYLALAGAVLAVGACNPFRTPMKQEPVVQVSTGDVNVNARWSGTLASPSNLAGAVQMKGSVTMTPGRDEDKTVVSVNLSNATPGGMHPWQLHRGQCSADDGVVGDAGAYPALKVDDYGRASSSATLPMTMPTTGSYHVSVGASTANPETIVACANLAPPSR